MNSENIDEICDDVSTFDNLIASQIELYQSKLAACQNMRDNPDYASKAILTHKLGDNTENSIDFSKARRYMWPIFFVLVGICALIIGLISVSAGAVLLNNPEASTPVVEAAIAASLAVYGAGIAILLFGADLFLQTKNDIRDESIHKKMFKDLEKIIAQNRKLIDLLEKNKEL
jgi:hypothetical protein